MYRLCSAAPGNIAHSYTFCAGKPQKPQHTSGSGAGASALITGRFYHLQTSPGWRSRGGTELAFGRVQALPNPKAGGRRPGLSVCLLPAKSPNLQTGKAAALEGGGRRCRQPSPLSTFFSRRASDPAFSIWFTENHVSFKKLRN